MLITFSYINTFKEQRIKYLKNKTTVQMGLGIIQKILSTGRFENKKRFEKLKDVRVNP